MQSVWGYAGPHIAQSHMLSEALRSPSQAAGDTLCPSIKRSLID